MYSDCPHFEWLIFTSNCWWIVFGNIINRSWSRPPESYSTTHRSTGVQSFFEDFGLPELVTIMMGDNLSMLMTFEGSWCPTLITKRQEPEIWIRRHQNPSSMSWTDLAELELLIWTSIFCVKSGHDLKLSNTGNISRLSKQWQMSHNDVLYFFIYNLFVQHTMYKFPTFASICKHIYKHIFWPWKVLSLDNRTNWPVVYSRFSMGGILFSHSMNNLEINVPENAFGIMDTRQLQIDYYSSLPFFQSYIQYN